MENKTWSFQLFGENIAGVFYEAQESKGSVLLCHGWGEHIGRYHSVIEDFLKAGYDVYGYDQRWHGVRKDNDPWPPLVEDLVRDHLEVRRIWSLEVRGGRKVLYGHSMGGLITAVSVARDSQGIDEVILSGPAVNPVYGYPKFLLKLVQFGTKWYPNLGLPSVGSRFLSHDPAIRQDFDNDPLSYQGSLPAQSLLSMVKMGQEAFAGIGDIRREIQFRIIQGTNDRLVSWRGVAEYVEKLRSHGIAVEFQEILGAYHEVHHESSSFQQGYKVI